jgi:hypothetical protein
MKSWSAAILWDKAGAEPLKACFGGVGWDWASLQGGKWDWWGEVWVMYISFG